MDDDARQQKLQAGKESLRKFRQKKLRKKKSPSTNSDTKHAPSDLPSVENLTHTVTEAEETNVEAKSPDHESVGNVHGSNVLGEILLTNGDHGDSEPENATVMNATKAQATAISDSQNNTDGELLQHLQQMLEQEQFNRLSLAEQLAEVQRQRDTDVQAMRQQIAELQQSSSSMDSFIETLQMQHVQQMQRLQSAHEEELQNLRTEEQRKRAEQVASLTQRLQAQHSEESGALHRQLQQLREDLKSLPDSTAALQQKVILVREQYEQQLAQAEQSKQDEVRRIQESQQAQLAQVQQQNFKQMEEFKSQVQESAAEQVQSFHQQYQLALSQQQQQLAAYQQQLAAMEQDRDRLQESLAAKNREDSGNEITRLHEQLQRLESSKQAALADLQKTCDQLNQKISSQSLQFANEKRQLEEQVASLEDKCRNVTDERDEKTLHVGEVQALEEECQQLKDQLVHQEEQFRGDRRGFEDRLAEKEEYCQQRCAQLEVTIQSLNSQLDALRGWSQPLEEDGSERLALAEARCEDLQLRNASLEEHLLQERTHRQRLEVALQEGQAEYLANGVEDGVAKEWEERCEGLEKKQLELMAAVKRKEQHIIELQAMQSSLLTQVKQMEEQTGAYESEIDRLKEDACAKDNKLLEMTNQERTLTNDLAELKAVVERQGAAYLAQEEQNQDAQAGLIKQIEELQSEVRGKESAHLVAMNELRLQYEEQYTQLQDDCHQQINSLRRQHGMELETYTQHQQHKEKSAAVVEQLEAERDRVLHDYERECQERERLADDLRSVAEERASLTVQKARLEQRVAELVQQEQQEAKGGGDRWQKLQASHIQLQDEHSSLKVEFENLEKKYSNVCGEVSGMESSLGELSAVHDEMKEKLKLSEETSNRLQEELSTVKDLLAAEQQQHIQVGQFESAKEEELEKVHEELTRLAEQLNEKESELRLRDEECSQLEAALSSQAADLSQIQVRMDRSRQEQERLLSLLEKNDIGLNDELAALKTEMQRLKEDNLTKEDALQKMARDLAEAEEELDCLQQTPLINNPLPVDNSSNLTAAAVKRNALEENLSRQQQLLEGKMLEKARLEELLDEQRSALTRQLEEKAKLEQLLEEKGRLETELLRQRTVLEQELSSIGAELGKRQRVIGYQGQPLQEVQG